MPVLRHVPVGPAVNIIRDGGLLVLPTDTVWGLCCDALNPTAVQNLRTVKQKPAAAPLIWLLPSWRAITQHCGPLTPTTRRLLRQPHTSVVINGQAVRLVRNGWLHRLLQRCGTPVVATSANRHGAPTVTSWRQAVQVFGDAVTVVRGRKITHAQPSQVVAVGPDGQTQIIRQGGGISIK